MSLRRYFKRHIFTGLPNVCDSERKWLLVPAIIFIVLIICAMVSCKTQQIATTENSDHSRDSVVVNTEYIHDSIYVYHYEKEIARGDTVIYRDSIVNNFYIYRDRTNDSQVNKQDSVIVTVEVPVEKELTKNQVFLIRSGVALWAMLVAAIVAVIAILIYKFKRK